MGITLPTASLQNTDRFLRLFRDRQYVDVQEKPNRHLRTTVQRGCARGSQGLTRPKAPGASRCPQSSGYQGSDFPEVPRLCQGTVCLEALLLVPHQRGHPVPEGLPPPAPRNCPPTLKRP